MTHRRLTPFLIQWAKNQWESGASVAQIAEEIGVSRQHVYILRHRHGWPHRHHQAPPPTRRCTLSPPLMVAAVNGGCTLQEVADEAGVTRERVRQIIEREGGRTDSKAHEPLKVLQYHAAGMGFDDTCRAIGFSGQTLTRVSRALGIEWPRGRKPLKDKVKDDRRGRMVQIVRDLSITLGRSPVAREVAATYFNDETITQDQGAPRLIGHVHPGCTPKSNARRGFMQRLYAAAGVPAPGRGGRSHIPKP